MSDPFAVETNTGDGGFSISDSAEKRLAFLFEQEGRPNLMLRIKVSGGGCSGYQYSYDFEQTVHEDDSVFGDDVKVVIDEVSLGLLAGSEIDFVDDMIGSSFQIKNPNATSSCGCGTSFAI